MAWMVRGMRVGGHVLLTRDTRHTHTRIATTADCAPPEPKGLHAPMGPRRHRGTDTRTPTMLAAVAAHIRQCTLHALES